MKSIITGYEQDRYRKNVTEQAKTETQKFQLDLQQTYSTEQTRYNSQKQFDPNARFKDLL